MVDWKKGSAGQTALLIEGARRVGKTTIVKHFAEKEYVSCIFIDFSTAGEEVKSLFDNLLDLNYLFLQLQLLFHVKLEKRKSLIVFDEVQFCPKARQAIKILVADGRYDYIETGSLISIRQNVKGILIPSEEEKLRMHPMDFEEFLWAMGDHSTIPFLKEAFKSLKGIGERANREVLRLFRLYLLVGGMPQAVSAYIRENDFQSVDKEKRNILSLYHDDFRKLDPRGRLSYLYDLIPAQLSSGKTFFVDRERKATKKKLLEELLPDLIDSRTVLPKYDCDNPEAGMSKYRDSDKFKLYLGDVGLFVAEAFADKEFTENVLYRKLLSDKLSADLGYLFENAVAQMLSASGYTLFYNVFKDETAHRYYETDFLIPKGDKLCPIEVKSGEYRSHRSLDMFQKRYSKKILRRYLLTTKDLHKDGDIICLPVYMAMFL
ncbi:MAG: ATP-binding protein [Firmicutes bacterium]|uniref:ATP-binding protein n=1 Tax=Candidatus Alloenteromonas pullistercoris TaxID=2840785 RepID=A0A9D9GT45_9FIRM|nr:ATP-binding protein [Candidatus Enteromonas pullistercoris]